LRPQQAFGRLIRRADDRGVFVLLDPMMPSRLKGAFPEGVELKRVGLAEVVSGDAGVSCQSVTSSARPGNSVPESA
jgi:Rad3-related DNA helicase